MLGLYINIRISYHRFVKTTPKPRATKKSRGELVGPLPPPPEAAEVVGPFGAAVAEDAGRLVVAVPPMLVINVALFYTLSSLLQSKH